MTHDRLDSPLDYTQCPCCGGKVEVTDASDDVCEATTAACVDCDWYESFMKGLWWWKQDREREEATP